MARAKVVGPIMALAQQMAALPAEDRELALRIVDELTPQTKRRRRRKKKDDDEAEVEEAPKKVKKTKRTKKAKKEKKLLAGTDSDE